MYAMKMVGYNYLKKYDIQMKNGNITIFLLLKKYITMIINKKETTWIYFYDIIKINLWNFRQI